MFLQKIKQASVTGLSASSVATAKIPTTGRHFALYFRFLHAGADVSVSDMKTTIGNMVVRLNGEQIIEATCTFLLDLQKYYGDAHGDGNVAGILPIYFAPSHLPNFVERMIYAIGTRDLQSFTVDMNVLSVTNCDTIDVWSLISPEIIGVGQHVRIKKYSQNFASTGENEVSNLPLEGPSVAYKALHITAGSGSFNTVTIKVANNRPFDTIPVSLNTVSLARSGRTAQSGYYHVAFDEQNDLSSLLFMQGVQDFRQVINWTTQPDNYIIYAEEVFGLATNNK